MGRGERSRSQDDGRTGKRDSQLLHQDPGEQDQIAVLEKKLNRKVHGIDRLEQILNRFTERQKFQVRQPISEPALEAAYVRCLNLEKASGQFQPGPGGGVAPSSAPGEVAQ